MLNELSKMSQIVGARLDYVQGGGGNTSVKFDDGTMAIKASGYRLSQVTPDDGFAIVELETLKDITTERGFKALRPSVEASFHALLGKFVIHTHPVYANLALCSESGLQTIEKAIKGYDYIIVPYINPGAELAKAIKDKLKPETKIVFMVNHGLVVTAETADECIKIHDEINKLIAEAYGVTQSDFEKFANDLKKTLYPDQQVYLTLTEVQQEILSAVMFIQMTLSKRNEQVQAMDENAMDFIANWESEAYRKTLLK